MNIILKYILNNLKITKNFKIKLKHNFSSLTFSEIGLYFIFIRPFLSKEEKFFFEGCKRLFGQMYVRERKAMYDTIIKYKPRICFEIGTYTGGGSTFFISSALKKNSIGRLVTLENNERLYNKAKTFYQKNMPDLNKYVEFVFGGSFRKINKFIEDSKIECFFLDGAEDGQQTLDQYYSFLEYCHEGTIMMIHDWNTEKTVRIKPIILNDSKWKKELELTPPDSVGFVVFKRM